MLKENSIRTKWADVEITKDGHISIRINENAEVTLEAIKAINDAKNELADGKKHTVIFITPLDGNITSEAREFSASEEVYKNAIAKAIVARSLASRLISNFFIKIQRPPAPTKMFKSESDAIIWLNRIRSNEGV